MTRELYESNRAELYSRASHALRTPLSIMMLEAALIDDPRARDLEASIFSLGESIRRSFLLLSIYDGGRAAFSPCDLATLLREAVEGTASGRPTAELELDTGAITPVDVVGYAEGIREAAAGVIENALRFTPAGGRVRIACGPEPVILVEDSGPGMAEVLPHGNFEPFVGTAPDGSGAGIGLALADAVAKLHGGSLTLGRSGLGGLKVVLSLRRVA